MEEWRNIEGFEGKYQVSNMGRVKSMDYNHTGREQILKTLKDGHGYLFVRLCKSGRTKNYTIHRLVAEVFLSNPDRLSDVNHKDENKENNCVDNLEWCSHKYNVNYGTGIKRASEKRRNDPKRSKPVMSINKESGLIMEYPSVAEARRCTGVDSSHIISCCSGKRKSAGGYFWQYID